MWSVDIDAALLPSSICEIRLTDRPVRLASCLSVSPGLRAQLAQAPADHLVEPRLEVDEQALLANRGLDHRSRSSSISRGFCR